MASEQFINYVKKELDIYKKIYGFKSNRDAFEPWSLQYLLGLDRDLAVNNTDTLARGDEGLDGWYYDGDNNVFNIFQMKYPDDVESEYSGEAGDELIEFYNKLILKDYIFKNQKLQLIHDTYYEAHNPDIKIKFNLVIFSRVNEKYKNKFKDTIKQLDEDLLFELFDIEKLFSLYIDDNDMDDLKNVTVSLDILNGQYIELPPKDPESIGKAGVITLSAKSFSNIVKEYYPNIVARNVRFHLGNKYNMGMVNLLQDETKNYKFWYYNNGITILCDSWDVDPSSEKVNISNPQIINGGQTSKTLSENLDYINDEVYVLAKIIQLGTDEEKAKYEALKISETSNTQNKVTSADLKALCPIQKAIKANFNNLNPKWYYEIKNKEWNVLSSSEKRQYERRKLNKTDIGQEWRMVNDNPIEAITKKEEMYTNNKLYTKVFSADRNVYEYLYAHKVVSLFTQLINENNFTIINNYDNSFSQDTLTRILSAKKISIGYMSYLLNLALSMENEKINYNDICNKLDVDNNYFDLALRIIIMSFRDVVDSVNMSESILNNLRQDGSLNKCIIKFKDSYNLMTQFGKNKIFN